MQGGEGQKHGRQDAGGAVAEERAYGVNEGERGDAKEGGEEADGEFGVAEGGHPIVDEDVVEGRIDLHLAEGAEHFGEGQAAVKDGIAFVPPDAFAGEVMEAEGERRGGDD